MSDLTMRVVRTEDCPFLFEEGSDLGPPACNVKYIQAREVLIKTFCVGPYDRECPLQKSERVVVRVG